MDSYPVTREKLAKGGLFAGLPPEIVNKIFEFVTELRTLPSSIFQTMKRWTSHYNAFERLPQSFMPYLSYGHLLHTASPPPDPQSLIEGTAKFYGPGFTNLHWHEPSFGHLINHQLLNRPYKW